MNCKQVGIAFSVTIYIAIELLCLYYIEVKSIKVSKFLTNKDFFSGNHFKCGKVYAKYNR